jgi:hypothetical protein
MVPGVLLGIDPQPQVFAAQIMNDHRWKVWNSYFRTGRVRYRSAEYKCADEECRRWHGVTAKSRNIRYEERGMSLEERVLNALLTSATHGCQHKKARKEVETLDNENVSKDVSKPQVGEELC